MDFLIEQQREINQQSVLKEYYARYLTEVRGLSDSSVKHYFDALNNISKRLKEKGLVTQDVYEIADLERLEYARKILYEDPDFIAMNERGKRMYSAGLNNYCRFASGEEFYEMREQMTVLDVPVAPEASITIEQSVWRRSGILHAQAIEIAGCACEMDPSHRTFISEVSKKPYMESHHALPMNNQKYFDISLDVYANIVCLCPVCHRQIHHGLKQDRIDMAKRIYDRRIPRLIKCGINLCEADFVKIAAGL